MTTELNTWLPLPCLFYPRSFHSPPVAYWYLYPYSIFCICLTLPSFKYSLLQSSLKRERKEVCCLASESLQYYLIAEQYSVLLPLIIWLMNALWLEFNFPPVFTIINNCTIAAKEGLLWITQKHPKNIISRSIFICSKMCLIMSTTFQYSLRQFPVPIL